MHALLIQQADGKWRIGHMGLGKPQLADVQLPAGAAVEESAAALAAALKAAGHSAEPVMVGLASATCLVASVPIDRAVRSRDRQQLLYALEEPLPWATEEMEADFQGRVDRALGVAVRIDDVGPLIEALEQRAIVVQSIAPVALLAAQHAAARLKPSSDVLLWQDHDQVELVELADAMPVGWQSLPASAATLTRQLHVLSLLRSRTLRVAPLGLESVLQSELALHWPLDEVADTVTRLALAEAATATAHDLLSGKREPWFDLRRGALAAGDTWRPVRRSVRFLLSAAAAFMLCMSAACLLRAGWYQQQLADSRGQQQALFRQALPGHRLPGGIRSRLESEAAKLAGLTGQHVEVSARRPVLTMLHDTLAALPAQLRFRLIELHFSDARLDLEGEVLAHGDADRLAAGLRQHGFNVDPPRTEQLPLRGVSVSVDALYDGALSTSNHKDI